MILKVFKSLTNCKILTKKYNLKGIMCSIGCSSYSQCPLIELYLFCEYRFTVCKSLQCVLADLSAVDSLPHRCPVNACSLEVVALLSPVAEYI